MMGWRVGAGMLVLQRCAVGSQGFQRGRRCSKRRARADEQTIFRVRPPCAANRPVQLTAPSALPTAALPPPPLDQSGGRAGIPLSCPPTSSAPPRRAASRPPSSPSRTIACEQRAAKWRGGKVKGSRRVGGRGLLKERDLTGTECHAVPCGAMRCHAVPCGAMRCHALP